VAEEAKHLTPNLWDSVFPCSWLLTPFTEQIHETLLNIRVRIIIRQLGN